MKLRIEIDMDNAAFDVEGESRRFKDAGEVARILRQMVVGWPGTTLEAGESYDLRDFNGNACGKAKVTR